MDLLFLQGVAQRHRQTLPHTAAAVRREGDTVCVQPDGNLFIISWSTDFSQMSSFYRMYFSQSRRKRLFQFIQYWFYLYGSALFISISYDWNFTILPSLKTRREHLPTRLINPHFARTICLACIISGCYSNRFWTNEFRQKRKLKGQ